MQQNDGALRPLRIVTRPGSILEPGWNAAVAAGNHETSMRIVDAVFKAMAAVIPERLSAGGPATSGLLSLAEPMADQGWRMLYEVHGGGEGARHDRDGVSATRVHLTNTSNTPAEVIEANYAIRVERQAIRRGAGGAGQHRGGDGVIRSYRVLAPTMWLTSCVERMVVPPYGLAGGEPGATFALWLERDGVPPCDPRQGEHGAAAGRSADDGKLRRWWLRDAGRDFGLTPPPMFSRDLRRDTRPHP